MGQIQIPYDRRLGGQCQETTDGGVVEIFPGQVYGLVGESGSGKSVTGFSIIGLIDPPGRVAGGSIRFNGEELVGAPPERMRALRGKRIAMIFQDPMMTLNPVLSIETQMVETVLAHERVSRQAARTRSIEALSRVGIASAAERLQQYPHQFSGGMRQRVAIAIALLHNPELIIADEPTTALDVTVQGQILYEMQKLTRESGTSLIWITHDLAVVAGLADRIAVMYAGRIVEIGDAGEVLDGPRHPYTRGLLDSVPAATAPGQRLKQISGSTPSLLRLGAGCAFRDRCPRAGQACGRRGGVADDAIVECCAPRRIVVDAVICPVIAKQVVGGCRVAGQGGRCDGERGTRIDRSALVSCGTAGERGGGCRCYPADRYRAGSRPDPDVPADAEPGGQRAQVCQEGCAAGGAHFGLLQRQLQRFLDGIAKRCGAIRTRAVQRTTTLLLLRLRYHIVTGGNGGSPLLAEDSQVIGLTGSPADPVWLSQEEAEALLQALPDANVAPQQATHFIQRVLAGWESLQAPLNQLAEERGAAILEAHQRVRVVARLKGVRTMVRPQLPPDLPGLYLLQLVGE